MKVPTCCSKVMELKAVTEIWNINRTDTVSTAYFQCKKCGKIQRKHRTSDRDFE